MPIIKEEEGELSGHDMGYEVMAVALRTDLQMNRHENPDPLVP